MNTSNHRPWYRRIGPGLITACVVIGPGSIVTSSTVGATHGYSMLWIVLLAVSLQITFMTLASRLGSIDSQSIGDMLRTEGKPLLALAVGICVFFISAAFQSGNNVGVASVFQTLLESEGLNDSWLTPACVILFNAVAITFLFAFRDLYQLVERTMMFLVAMMLACFTINLIVLKPEPTKILEGFIPRLDLLDINTLGLVGTTFVVAAAFYQAYLVRQKGWTQKDVESGSVDVWIGGAIMGLITMMLMATAAAGLYQEGGSTLSLSNPVELAKALEPTFGQTGKFIFCLGLFSAAYSSFLVNSMIGGFILSDGLSLGCDPQSKWPRLLTTLTLLVGMFIALAAMVFKLDPAPTIIAANAVTVVGSPLIAIVIVWLSRKKAIFETYSWSFVIQSLTTLGIIMLLAMAFKTAVVTIPNKIDQYRNQPSEQPEELPKEPSSISRNPDQNFPEQSSMR